MPPALPAAGAARARAGACLSGRWPARRFLPPDPRVEEPYRLTPQSGGPHRHPRRDRGRRSSRCSSSGSGRSRSSPATSTSRRPREQPDPHGPPPAAARADPGQKRGTARVERPGHRRPALACLHRWPPRRGRSGAVRAPRRSGQGDPPPGQGPRGRPAHAGDRQDERPRRRGRATSASTRPSFPGCRGRALRSCAGTSRARSPPTLLGYVGEIAQQELERLGSAYAGGDRIGKTGIEAAYDNYLRGEPGVGQVRVNALTRRTSAPAERAAEGRLRRAPDDRRRSPAGGRGRHQHTGSSSPGRTATGRRTAVRSWPWIPATARSSRSRPNPTYDPIGVRRAPDPKKHDRALRPDGARGAQLPDAQPRDRRRVPGRLDLQARHGARRARRRPDHAGRVLPVRRPARHRRPDVQELGPVRERADDAATALARSCDTYFYDVGKIFYERRTSPLQAWARKMGFGSRPASTSAPRRPASCRRRRGASGTYANPMRQAVDERRLRAARDRAGRHLVTPMQMTRFYSLVANGGKLVNPHLVEDDRAAGGLARGGPGRPAQLRAGAGPRAVGLPGLGDPGPCRRASTRRPTSSTGRAYGIFGGLPGVRGRQDRNGREVRPATAGVPRPSGLGSPAARPGVVLRLRADRRSGALRPARPLVVCALIENGGHGGEVAAPAALEVFAEYWGVARPGEITERCTRTDGHPAQQS